MNLSSLTKTAVFLLPVLCILQFFPQHSEAQNQEKISIGGGIIYGFDLEDTGVQAVGTYLLTNNIRMGADFVYWLPDDIHITSNDQPLSFTLFEMNANLHYILNSTGTFQLYGLASLGLHYSKTDGLSGPYFTDSTQTEMELGLGIGAGLEANLRIVKLYVEPRYFMSGIEQFSVSGGIRIPF